MKKKWLKILMAVTALALVLCQYACSGSARKNSSSDSEPRYTAETSAAREYYDEEEYPEYATSDDYSAGKANAFQDGGSYSETRDEQGRDIPAATLDEKLVYTCNMDMETTEYEKTIASIRELIQKYGGIIERETYTDSASDWYYTSYEKKSGTLQAYIVVRIPSQYYRDFLSGMDGFGKVTRSEQNVENITRRYSETETTVKSLEIQEERLLEMMEQAETIDEMLQIEYRLTEVQNELQILKNLLSEMDTDVAYSTVNLNVREVLEFTPEVEPKKVQTFGDRLRNALKNSWSNITGFLEGVLFFLIEAGPILLIIGGISVAVLVIVLKSVKRARKKKAEKAAENAAVYPQTPGFPPVMPAPAGPVGPMGPAPITPGAPAGYAAPVNPPAPERTSVLNGTFMQNDAGGTAQ